MKIQEITAILKEISNHKDIDDMSFKEMRETLILMTGLVLGVLLTTGHSKEEIKSLIK